MTSFESELQINTPYRVNVLGNLSNTADMSTRFETIDCGSCPIVFNSAASDYYYTYIHTYIPTYIPKYIVTYMLASWFVGTTAFRVFPMSMGLECRTGIQDEHVVHVGGHLRGISTFSLQSADHSWNEKEADETGRLLDRCSSSLLTKSFRPGMTCSVRFALLPT